ncbi:predicted protein [Sclerotinia sclerotiorum 1980 UF-70]|uniref:Uncharacterized protein n=1 Tax=Sclerotinia sclerotiorum (strain ATCC 18683 / 1980 / Ss-1) TaxID=665079 RepID=A7E4Q3_SCLS1|nr:predicted protein [Sclerotinia sclerotiorum 1980 UF-70]EDN90875.1 predicted protein [Sclerotinia sclerotiorum 1980 UF-70]
MASYRKFSNLPLKKTSSHARSFEADASRIRMVISIM